MMAQNAQGCHCRATDYESGGRDKRTQDDRKTPVAPVGRANLYTNQEIWCFLVMGSRWIGFSTGALAKGDFREGLRLQPESCAAVELSALREHELEPLLSSLSRLDVGAYRYVSVHAPSKLVEHDENWLIERLTAFPEDWPIVVHPDLVRQPSSWLTLGSRLCLENMDIRKPTGRTADEMEGLFKALPEAGFCFDLGHARQIDPTMTVAMELLRRFKSRLRQLHVSDVGTFGEHRPIGYLTRLSFEVVVPYIDPAVPVIIESVVEPAGLESELRRTREIFAA